MLFFKINLCWDLFYITSNLNSNYTIFQNHIHIPILIFFSVHYDVDFQINITLLILLYSFLGFAILLVSTNVLSFIFGYIPTS